MGELANNLELRIPIQDMTISNIINGVGGFGDMGETVPPNRIAKSKTETLATGSYA